MKTHILPLLTLLLVACGGGNTTDNTTYTIDPNSTNTIKMSDFVESVSLIKLEVTRESMLSSISEIFFDDDYLIVHSRGEILFFTKEGRYSHKISRKGRGNGEYLAINAVTIDPDNNQVIIVSNQRRMALFYNYDGEFVRGIKKFGEERTYMDDIKLLPDGSFLSMNSGFFAEIRDKLWRLDSEGRVIEDILIGDFSHPAVHATFSLSYINDEEIGFMDCSTQKDYIYKDGELHLVASFDIMGLVAKDFQGVDHTEHAIECSQNRRSFNSRPYSACKGDYIFTRWSPEVWDNPRYYSLVNRRSGSVVVGQSIDGRLANSQQVCATVGFKGEPYYQIVDCNLEGAMAQIVNPETITDTEVLRYLGIASTEEAESMNPIIQLLHIKK